MKSFAEKCREKEKFREHLVKIIKCHGGGGGESSKREVESVVFPGEEEKETLRYYYYIQRGANIRNVPPLQNSWLENILKLLPENYAGSESLKDFLEEVKEDFLFSVKKSVVDFALGYGKDGDSRCLKENFDNYERNKSALSKHLLLIHPLLMKIQFLWHSNYERFRLINFIPSVEAVDIRDFDVRIKSELATNKNVLLEKWIPAIFNIVLQVSRKKKYKKMFKSKEILFYETISALMALQLQDLCLETMMQFTNFICKKQKTPVFKVNLLYEENRIIFQPSHEDMNEVLWNVYGEIIKIILEVHQTQIPFCGNFESSFKVLKPVILDEIVENHRNRIFNVIENEWLFLELKIEDFDAHIDLINGKYFRNIQRFVGDNGVSFEDIKEKLSFYKNVKEVIASSLETSVSSGIFELRRGKFVETLLQKAKCVEDLLVQRISDDCQKQCKLLNEEFEAINNRLLRIPLNTKELVEIKWFCMNLGLERLYEMEDKLRIAMDYILYLADYRPLVTSSIKQNAVTFLWYRRINGCLDRNREMIREKSAEFQKLLREQINNFLIELEEYDAMADEFETFREIENLSKYAEKANVLIEKLEKAKISVADFNEEEDAFGWLRSAFPKMDEIEEKLEPYKELYENCIDYKMKYGLWTESKIGSFHPDEIMESVRKYRDKILRLNRNFQYKPAPYSLTLNVKQDIESFQSHFSIVETLGNPRMKDRHWERVSDVVGFPLKAEGGGHLTLAKIFDYGLEEYAEAFKEVSEAATRENSLEQELNGMMKRWENVRFQIQLHGDSGTFILASMEEIQILLDEHIANTEIMRHSPYIKPFETAISAWEEKLTRLQKIIDAWSAVQRSWLYLEPIFTRQDAQSQMQEEFRRFSAVDKIWKDIMKSAASDTAALAVIEIEKMSERLEKSISMLDAIRRGVYNHLDNLRAFFPRFFFLSNEEILDIISKIQNPDGIKSAIGKCFEGVYALKFNDEMDVTGVESSEGDVLDLSERIATKISSRQAEKWLLQLEKALNVAVKNNIFEGFKSYKEQERETWILNWPIQTVFVASNVMATAEIEEAIQGNSLGRCLEMWERRLGNLREILNRNVDSKTRRILHAYRMENIRSLMEEGNCDSRISKWSQNLRFYIRDGEVEIIIKEERFPYGYEYSGNYECCVWTKSFERELARILTNFSKGKGVYLKGGTGFGKSTLAKELARICGKGCVFFNCCCDPDPGIVRNLFKGVVSSNSWICLEDLSRMDGNSTDALSHAMTMIWQNFQSGGTEEILLEGRKWKFVRNLVAATDRPGCGSNEESRVLTNSFFEEITLEGNGDFEFYIDMKLLHWGIPEGDEANEIMYKCVLSAVKNDFCRSHLKFAKDLSNDVERRRRKFSNSDVKRVILESFQRLCDLDRPFMARAALSDGKKINEAGDDFKREAIGSVWSEMNVTGDEYLLKKVCQLFEAVRTSNVGGVVVVGEAFSGKSTIIKTLSKCYARLEETGSKEEVETVTIYPKCYPLEDLYGYRNDVTHEWIDGIISYHFRTFLNSDNCNGKWLILDGPLDPRWTDNLTSLLDDCQKLTLKSGERIQTNPDIKFIFETVDVANMSPAMISRCRFVYMERKSGGWKNLADSWLKTSKLDSNKKSLLESLISHFCPPLFHAMSQMKENLSYPISEIQAVKSLCDMLDCFDLCEGSTEQSEIDCRAQFEGTFFFACIWSLGGALDACGKTAFDVVFRALMTGEFPRNFERFQLPAEFRLPVCKAFIYVIPDRGTVFDYYYVKAGKGKWKLWSEMVSSCGPIPRDISFPQIIVPTEDSVRIKHLITLLTGGKKEILIAGPPATGKTVLMRDSLKHLDKGEYEAIPLNFTRGMEGKLTQRLIIGKLDKRKKGVYGPPLRLKYIFFADDVQSPAKDAFGDRSSTEILRQLIDRRSWHVAGNSSSYFAEVVDLQFICAVTRGEGYDICPRFARHFNVVTTGESEDAVLKSIFSKVILWHFDTRGFSKEFDSCIDQLVDATVAVHRWCQRHLERTRKSTTMFNFKDYWRVIQGIVSSVPEAVEDKRTMKRFWVHEISRVYQDKLGDARDKARFLLELDGVVKKEFGPSLADMFKHVADEKESLEGIANNSIFCDFTNPKADIRNYAEVENAENLQGIVEGYLTEHNNVSKKPMKLVLFRYAVGHVARICRILKQPFGHAALVSDGGFGKHSLARLAVHICEYELFQVEVTKHYGRVDWRRDLKEVLKSACADQHSVLLLSDVQFEKKGDFMLEDACHLMLTGSMPELFSEEETADICEKMEAVDSQREKSAQTDGSAEALLTLFQKRVRKQIHVVLIFHPESFWKYAGMFPVLKFCFVNWFHPWPEEGMRTVALKMLKEDVPEAERIVPSLKEMHETASEHLRSVGIAVNPKSYVNFVGAFRRIYTLKRRDISEKISQLETAMEQLTLTRERIPVLAVDFAVLAPMVMEKGRDVRMGEESATRAAEEETATEVAVNAAKTAYNNAEKKLRVARGELSKKLERAGRDLDDAGEKLRLFSSGDFAALKNVKNPAKIAKAVAEALAVAKDVKCDKAGDRSGRLSEDLWKPAVKMASDPKFGDTLRNFDRDALSDRQLQLLAKCFAVVDECGGLEKMKQHSAAAVMEGIYLWTKALYDYGVLTSSDAPANVEINGLEEGCAVQKAIVEGKQRDLDTAREARKKMEDDTRALKAELEDLKKRVNCCAEEKGRGEKLVAEFGDDERVWESRLAALKKNFVNLAGNSLIASAISSYLSAVPFGRRSFMVEKWTGTSSSDEFPRTRPFSLSAFFNAKFKGEFVLPVAAAPCFAENASIFEFGEKWPLFVDAQGLMKDWVKEREKGGDLIVINAGRNDYQKFLENAVKMGLPTLLENVDENLDDILYPLLEKQIFKMMAGTFVKIGDNSVEYNPTFRLYLTTRVRNPPYLDSVRDKMLVLDCKLCRVTLRNYFQKIISGENAEEDGNSELKESLEDVDSNILKLFSSRKVVVQCEDTVGNLISCKSAKLELRKRLEESGKEMPAAAAATLVGNSRWCSSTSEHLADLYSLLDTISNLAPCYRYSLRWYENLMKETSNFVGCNGENSPDIFTPFLHSVFREVCDGLLPKHKLPFVVLLTMKCAVMDGLISENDYENFESIAFEMTNESKAREHAPVEIAAKVKEIYDSVVGDRSKWRYFRNALTNDAGMRERMDDVLYAAVSFSISGFISDNFAGLSGKMEFFLEAAAAAASDLGGIFERSDCRRAIVMFRWKEIDPVKRISELAAEFNLDLSKRLWITLTSEEDSFSLELAEKAAKEGVWLVVKNLDKFHRVWNGAMETFVDRLIAQPDFPHPDFRLWIVLSCHFPLPVALWNSVKIVAT